MKLLTACTFEVDDADLAVAEIRQQLDLAHSLQKNALGVVTCHLEYMENGVLKAVCDSLPFDVIGMNTQMSGTPEGYDQMALAVCVLTADDVEFSTQLSNPLREADENELPRFYQAMCAPLSGNLAMTLVFAPLMVNDLGDDAVALIDEISGGVPLFGSVAIDYTDKMRSPRVLFNGESYADRVVAVTLSGNIQPEFFHFTFSQDLLLEQKAIITKGSGDVIYEINDMLAIKYLESLGLAQDGKVIGTSAIPFAIDAHDGKPAVIRNIFNISPEGYIECGGTVKQGATLAIGSNDKSEVLRTANLAARALLESGKKNGAILLSCATRSFALDFDEYAEIELFARELNGKLPYLFAYSGGEIGPVLDHDGNQVNDFHNSSIILCAF